MKNVYEVFLPTSDNEGVKFSEDKMLEVLEKIAGLTGGLTVNKINDHIGFWKDPSDDTIIMEEGGSFWTVCYPNQIKKVAQLIGEELDQEEIMILRIPKEPIFFSKKGADQ